MRRAALTFLLALAPFAAGAEGPLSSDPLNRMDAPPLPGARPAPGLSAAAPDAAAPALSYDVSLKLNAVLLVPADSPLGAVPGLREAAAARLGGVADLAALEALRRELTEALVSAGYVSSGVLLREIDLDAGTATYELVAGRLVEIRVSGDGVATEERGFGEIDPDYVARRLDLSDGPFALPEAEERLRILLRDRTIERVDAAIRPGARLGETALDLDVKARRPFDFSFTVANDTPDSVGEETARLGLAFRNLVTPGDELRAQAELTEGRKRLVLDADAPLWPGGPAPFAAFELSQSDFVREPFRSANVASDFVSAGFGLRVPVIETSRRRLTGIVSLDWKRGRSTVAGVPFSFEPGPRNGLSKTAVLSFAGEYVDLGEARTIALRAAANLGLPILGATENPAGTPDGEFLTLVGQAQTAILLDERATLIARAQGQWASRALLPLEQVAIGGRDTVRGFGEAVLAGDDAVVGGFELRYALTDLPAPELTPAGHEATVTIAPFLDAGAVRRKGGSFQELVGAGAGLLWTPAPGFDMAFWLGAKLSGSPRGAGIQGEGAHFAVTVALP